VPRERGPQNGGYADRVLVDVRLDVVGPDDVFVGLQRDDARLNVEVATELLPHDMHVAAEDEVWPARVLALLVAPFAPLPLQRQRAEHDRLRRSLRACAGRLARGVEQVGEHPDATLLDLRRLRILGVVDEVTVQVLGDDPLGLRLHPGRHEGRQVALRDPVEDELLADQSHRVDRAHAVLRQPVIGRRLEQEAVSIGSRQGFELVAERALVSAIHGLGRGNVAWLDRHRRPPSLGRRPRPLPPVG
jgi:hypothetical protein